MVSLIDRGEVSDEQAHALFVFADPALMTQLGRRVLHPGRGQRRVFGDRLPVGAAEAEPVVTVKAVRLVNIPGGRGQFVAPFPPYRVVRNEGHVEPPFPR